MAAVDSFDNLKDHNQNENKTDDENKEQLEPTDTESEYTESEYTESEEDEEADNENWIKLISLPTSCHKWIKIFNNNINSPGFIVMSNEGGLNVYTYDTNTNQFNALVVIKDIDNAAWRDIENAAFDCIQQKLYIWHERFYFNRLCSIDINTKAMKILDKIVSRYKSNYFLCINNYCHMINTHDCNWLSSLQNNKIVTLSTHNSEICYHSAVHFGEAVYVSSKQCILLIGGIVIDNGGTMSTDIWRYSLPKAKWTKVNDISFQRHSFAAVLTSNQRYIVLFGGLKGTRKVHQADDIFVLDMKNDNDWKLKKCKIKCPYIGDCDGAMTCGMDLKNEMLIIGFVKECFKMKQFENLQLPSTNTISIIAEYFSAEMIHYMNRGHHFGIYLKDILSTLL